MDIDSVARWFTESRLSLNANKCHVISFTRKLNCTRHNYLMNDSILVRKDECRDLGVWMQTTMKFNKHCRVIVGKAYRALGFVIRNTKRFRIDTIIKLYNALVRPHLEYAAIIWTPQTQSISNDIEKVQKRFLRYLYLKQFNVYPYMISYNAMLTTFKMERLNDRRNMHCIFFIFYIIHNIKYPDCNFIDKIAFNVPKMMLRIQQPKLFYVNPMICSPLNYMLCECNEFVQRHNIDMFDTSPGTIRDIFKSRIYL